MKRTILHITVTVDHDDDIDPADIVESYLDGGSFQDDINDHRIDDEHGDDAGQVVGAYVASVDTAETSAEDKRAQARDVARAAIAIAPMNKQGVRDLSHVKGARQ